MTIINYFLILIIKCYQYSISPWLGSNCRYYPTCSEYAKTSLINFNLLKATMLILKRLAKCHPYIKADYYDPLPIDKNK